MGLRIYYIPGLGDPYDGLRRFALHFWRRRDVTVELYPMKWHNDIPLQVKLERLRRMIAESDEPVALIGESAGGSVVVALTREYPDRIVAAATICGKNVDASNVSPEIYRRNPAFRESMQRADEALPHLNRQDKAKLTTFYSERDPTVRPQDTLIAGSRHETIAMSGHLLAIAYALTFDRDRIIRALKLAML